MERVRLDLSSVAVVVKNRSFLYSHRTELFNSLVQGGFNIYFYAGDDVKVQNNNFRELGGGSGYNLSKTLYTNRKSLKKFANIHIIGLVPFFVFCLLNITDIRRKNILISISGMGWIFTSAPRLLRAFAIIFLRSLRKITSAIIVQNTDDYNFFKKLGYERCYIIPGSGVDEKKFTYVPIRRNATKVRVLMTARLLRDKGVDEFVEASLILNVSDKSNFEFHLIGNYDKQNPSKINQTLFNKAVKTQSIIWHGKQDDVHSFIVESDVVVLPSYREGFPKVLIEAMAVGRPIITTDVAGCRECLSDNGFLIRPKCAEDLIRALKDFSQLSFEERKRFSDNSYKFFKSHLTDDHVYKSHLKIYTDTFNNQEIGL